MMYRVYYTYKGEPILWMWDLTWLEASKEVAKLEADGYEAWYE